MLGGRWGPCAQRGSRTSFSESRAWLDVLPVRKVNCSHVTIFVGVSPRQLALLYESKCCFGSGPFFLNWSLEPSLFPRLTNEAGSNYERPKAGGARTKQGAISGDIMRPIKSIPPAGGRQRPKTDKISPFLPVFPAGGRRPVFNFS